MLAPIFDSIKLDAKKKTSESRKDVEEQLMDKMLFWRQTDEDVFKQYYLRIGKEFLGSPGFSRYGKTARKLFAFAAAAGSQ